MSHSEDIYISYYSAVLAKALKVYDELTFNSLFEIISTVSDPEKVRKNLMFFMIICVHLV